MTAQKAHDGDLFAVQMGPYRYSAPRRLWRSGEAILLYVHQDNQQSGVSGKLLRYNPRRRTVEALHNGLPFEVISAARHALNRLVDRGELAVPVGVCGACPPEETYVCAGCGRRVPWCFGGHDDMPDHCDDCWAEAHPDAEEPDDGPDVCIRCKRLIFDDAHDDMPDHCNACREAAQQGA